MKPTCDTPDFRCRYSARPSNQEPCRSCDGETCWTPEDAPQRPTKVRTVRCEDCGLIVPAMEASEQITFEGTKTRCEACGDKAFDRARVHAEQQPRRLARKADSEMADYLTSGRATEAEMELYVYRRNVRGG